MGNNSSREGRRGSDGPQSQSSQPESISRQGAASNSTRGSGNRRSNRHDLSFFGLTSNSTQAPPERRETRQEREKRKLEKERAARIQERERSIREEHVDGGYLVTMGVYVGTEDFSKAIVRHLMVCLGSVWSVWSFS